MRQGRTHEIISLVEEYAENSKETNSKVPLYDIFLSHKFSGKNKDGVSTHTILCDTCASASLMQSHVADKLGLT